jgi:hypothetical protein
MHSGEHGAYRWLISSDFTIGEFLKKCREVLLGKCVVITAFDSGPITPSLEESQEGWVTHGNTMCSPRMTLLTSLPHEQFDEWYVFDEPRQLQELEVFVNYSFFTLRDPSYLLENTDPTWDRTSAEEDIEYLRKMQAWFWTQIETIVPESYIAEGDQFIFVTKNIESFESVQKAVL